MKKPRLPDRLKAELASRSAEVGRRRDGGGSRSQGPTRKDHRRAARLEKKQRKQRLPPHYRERQTTSPANRAPVIEASQATAPRQNAQKDSPETADMQLSSSQKRRLELAAAEERKKIKTLATRLKIADRVEEMGLDELLDGFGDDPVEGIPQLESPAEADPADSSTSSLQGEDAEPDGAAQSDSTDATSLQEVTSEDESDVGSEDEAEAVPEVQIGHSGSGKYLPPALRGGSQGLSQRKADVERKIRGLLNRLSEENFKDIVQEIVRMHGTLGRTFVSSAISEEIIKAIAEGPRATQRFLGIAAAAVSATACHTNSHEVSANFMALCAAQLERSYKQQDSLGSLNTLHLFCHLYLCGVLSPQPLYGLLHVLTQRFQDLDVTMMYHLLQACGLRLRSEGPDEMKQFVMAVHNRAAQQSKEGGLSQRAEMMLDLVIDIKNNRFVRQGKKESLKAISPSVGRWLQEIEVSKMALRHCTWAKIASPNKTGRWWLPDSEDREAPTASLVKSLGLGDELLSLAAAQRMNTDVRKAVFCVIMGAQDVLDACEKLLRMPLEGEQDREIVRVLVECCLREKTWNPFYTAVACRLCSSKRSHAKTLRFCLLDKLKSLEGMEVRVLDHLAKLMAELVQREVMPMGMLKGVDLSPSLSEAALFFWRIFLLHWMLSYPTTASLGEAAAKLNHSESLALFSKKLLMFLKFQFQPWIDKYSNDKLRWMQVEQQDKIKARCVYLLSVLKRFSSL